MSDETWLLLGSREDTIAMRYTDTQHSRGHEASLRRYERPPGRGSGRSAVRPRTPWAGPPDWYWTFVENRPYRETHPAVQSAVLGPDEEGRFPRPVSLGARAVGWVEAEVDEWMRERIAASRSDGE